MSTTTKFEIGMLAQHRGDALAVVESGSSTTYAELDRSANQVANGLVAEGIAPGDHVVYLGRNCLESVELLVGAARVGVVVVMLSWRLHPVELEVLLADCGARLVVVTDEFASVVAGMEAADDGARVLRVIGGTGNLVVDDTVHGTLEVDVWSDWVGRQSAEVPRQSPDDDVVAVQLYTSGTTGRPKGAMITAANLAATIPDICELWGLGETSVMLLVLPAFHIAGVATIIASLWVGATLVITNDSTPSSIAALVETHGVTNVVLVPVLIQGLLDVASGTGPDISSLRTISYGAAPISEQLLRRVIDVLGCRLLQIYGLTETTGCLTALTPDDHRLAVGDDAAVDRLRSCGRARPNVELRIVDPATGTNLGPNQVGEIQARSQRLMRGYWNSPEATDEVLGIDGWFRTGDLGELDEHGYLYLRDRLKDMIVSGGENIYPAEVENAMLWHPDVAEAAVIGVPDTRWGEVPKAIIVLVPGATATEAELIEHSRTRLARFKCPQSIDFAAALPRNATGKVLRRELREPFWSDQSRRIS